jgi:hypothetical protein
MCFPYIHNIPPYSKKNCDKKSLFKEDLKCFELWTKAFKLCGRRMNILMPDVYGPLVYFVKFTNAGWKLLLFLVLYLWISLLAVNKCLLLTVNSTNEYVYWEYNVIICMFLKISIQESLGLLLVMILMIFFCNINTFLAEGANVNGFEYLIWTKYRRPNITWCVSHVN